MLGSISIILVYLMLSQIDLRQLFKTIIGINPLIYLFAMVLYGLEYIIRILRLRVVMPNAMFSNWLIFIGVYQLTNRTFPFRTGELFFPILSKKILGFSYSDSISNWLIIRVCDLLVMSTLFLFFLAMVNLNESLVLILFFAMFVTSFVVAYKFRFRIVNYLIDTFGAKLPKYTLKIQSVGAELTKSLSLSGKQIVTLIFYTLLDQIINYGLFLLIVFGLGFNIALDKLCVAIGLSSFSEVLPINSVGNFGTLELGWVGALTFLGIDKSIAIESAFSTHIIVYSFTMFIGIFCGLAYLIRFKSNA